MTALPNRKPINILLVEDDEVDVMNVQRAFIRNKITSSIHHAANGMEALKMLRSNPSLDNGGVPRERLLILLDLNMPRMNGIEFLQELRQDPALQSISVIVLTTSDEERDRVEAYRLNVAGYILKPVTFDKFVSVVSRLSDYWAMCEMPPAHGAAENDQCSPP